VLTDYPLFPLPLVAFPGCRLPLQIFEPRYLDLVKATLANDSTFGVVTVVPRVDEISSPAGNAIKESSVEADIEAIGTAVKIVDFNEQPNGLLGIVCEGQHKFTVSQTYRAENKVFLSTVQPIEAESIMPVTEAFEELVYVLTSLLKHPYVESLGYIDREVEDWFTDASRLSFYLAYLLPFPNQQRYRLLALTNPIDRLILIQSLLDEMEDNAP
jgi:Lon protease-like protein